MQPRLFPLENTFEIGAFEKHTVKVRYTMFGRHVVWVDGKKVLNRFNWRTHYSIHVGVGENERHEVELRVKGRPFHFSLWLDGEAFLDPLFPGVTAERIQHEISTTLARGVSVVTFFGWLLLGGVHETTPKSLLMTVMVAVVLCAVIAMLYRKPRSWALFLVIPIIIFVTHDHPQSQMFLFYTIFTGLQALLGPWLRRVAMRDQAA